MDRNYKAQVLLTLILGLVAITLYTPMVVSSSAQTTPAVLKYSEMPGATGLRSECVKEFSRLVDERTGGKVKVELYWSESLVKAKENIRGVSTGVADMGWTTSLYNPAELAPFTYSQAIAFLFLTPGDQVKLHWKMYDQFPALQSNYLKWNQVPVMLWCYDTYEIQTKDKPIRNLEDFKGKKLRVSGGGTAMVLKAVGSVGVVISGGETYEAVQRGTVDGAVLPMDQAITYGMSQICKYVTFVNFAPAGHGFTTINKDRLESFPKHIQKIILDTGREISFKYAELIMEKKDKTLAEFTSRGCELIKLPRADIEKWQNMAEVVSLSNERKKFITEKGYPGDVLVDGFITKVKEYTK